MIYNLLPDISGILLAAVGVALVLVPEWVNKPPTWLRRGLALCLVGIGVAGLRSSFVQRREDAAEKTLLKTDLKDLQEKLATMSPEIQSLFDRPIQSALPKGRPILGQPKPILLSAKIYDPATPSIVVTNSSERTAQNAVWELFMYRENDGASFSFATQSIGYVKPHVDSAAYSMSLDRIPKLVIGGNGQPLRVGDTFTGSLSIDCPDCLGSTYIVHFTWGSGGWFYRVENMHGNLAAAKNQSKEGIVEFVREIEVLAKPEGRVAIIAKPPL